MRNIFKIIERIKLVYGASMDIELQKRAKINSNTLSNWKDRNSIPYKKLDEISQNECVSFDWLLTGKGEMLLKDEKPLHVETILSDAEQDLLDNFKILPDDLKEIYTKEIELEALKEKRKVRANTTLETPTDCTSATA